MDPPSQAFNNFSVFTLVEQGGTRFNAFGFLEQSSNQIVAGICQGVTIKKIVIIQIYVVQPVDAPSILVIMILPVIEVDGLGFGGSPGKKHTPLIVSNLAFRFILTLVSKS